MNYRSFSRLVTTLLFCGALGAIFLIFAPSGNRPPNGRDIALRTDDGVSLKATLFTPAKKPKGYVVLAHGNRKQGRRYSFYQQLAGRLSQDFIVLSIDFRGFGDSGPAPADFNSLDFSADLKSASRYLADRYRQPQQNIVLVGHSIGSLQVMHAGGILGSNTVIALGPGDLQKIYLDREAGRNQYRQKIEANSGIRLNKETLDQAVAPLLFPNIFKECGLKRLAVVYGEKESASRRNLQPYLDEYQERCAQADVSVSTVAGMDHMYGAESKDRLGRLANFIFRGKIENTTLLAERIRRLILQQRYEQKALPGQIIVDSVHPARLKYNGGGPYFLAGPGDPEGFLYRGSRNEDGTRNGDQAALIERLKATGANSIYLMAVRSHGGDARKDMKTSGDPRYQNPFIDGDPDKGLNQALLDQWEKWFQSMDESGITIFFIFYDDGSRIWNTKDSLGKKEKRFLRELVNRFKHHRHLIWCVAEEYDEKYTPARIIEMARIIRKADDHDHVIAVHKRPSLDFSEFADISTIDQFAVQYPDKDLKSLHRDTVDTFRLAAGTFNLNGSEVPYGGMGSGREARLKSWAIAMGGAYVMINGMTIAETPERDLVDMGNMVRFFESTDFAAMLPRDDLAAADTEYVLADPAGSLIAYSSQLESAMGITDMQAGTYRLTWFDIEAGRSYEQAAITIDSGPVTWQKPTGCGQEAALYVMRENRPRTAH